MVDEIRQGDESRLDVEQEARRRERAENVLEVRSADLYLREEKQRDNVFVLGTAEYGSARLTRPRTRVWGNGTVVTGQWLVSSDGCHISGVTFRAVRGTDPLVKVRGSARVTFSDCYFQMSPATASEAVNIETGCKVHFDGCVFAPDLNGGTGQPIAHAGAPGNVYITSCLNLTGRAHGASTVISELT